MMEKKLFLYSKPARIVFCFVCKLFDKNSDSSFIENSVFKKTKEKIRQHPKLFQSQKSLIDMHFTNSCLASCREEYDDVDLLRSGILEERVKACSWSTEDYFWERIDISGKHKKLLTFNNALFWILPQLWFSKTYISLTKSSCDSCVTFSINSKQNLLFWNQSQSSLLSSFRPNIYLIHLFFKNFFIFLHLFIFYFCHQ